MGNCVRPDQWHRDHAAAGLFLAFFNRGGHFVGLAIAPADAAFAIADDDQRGKTETPAALHHRGAAFDLHGLIDVVTATVIAFCHKSSPSDRLFYKLSPA